MNFCVYFLLQVKSYVGEIPWIFVRVINESSGMESGAMAGVGDETGSSNNYR